MGEQKEYLVTQTDTWVNRRNTWSYRHMGEQKEYLVTQTDTGVNRRNTWSHRQTHG
ncbi:hypothetical protein DPMN_157691 [Dreissena polymorpha]|uniref:Uncharacterized protein n=1 Tax=Dreissena polymorpha TaxID=45954 RepID=A0A9D4IQ84_DREPO|nr:hypothetical protein DPMN_157691 [Dreissena polymorpha]